MCCKSLASLKVLHKGGANLDLRTTMGKAPLLRAVENGFYEGVEYLLNSGVKTEVRCDLGMTPLLVAAAAASYACVSLLLKSGADVEATDRYFGFGFYSRFFTLC